MKTPLAWLNLAHYKMRTAAAVAGVAFSVVLIFMQWGFLGSVERTASLLFDALEFDVLLRSPRYLHVGAASSIPRERLYQAASVRGVGMVSPLHVGATVWRNPHTGQGRRILAMGLRPGDQVFRVEEIERKSSLLVTPESVIIDRESRGEFGPEDGLCYGDADIGTTAEAGGRRVKIIGTYSLGGGFAADGGIVLGEEGFARVYPGRTADEVSFGLVRLAPGADADEVVARLRDVLPADVDVMTRREAIGRELTRWVTQTSIGVIFQLGVAVALVVGIAIVYQVLSSDVANHLAEYATLKAIGYGNRFVSGVVLGEAVALAVLGFLPGLAIALLLYRVTSAAANIPVVMTLTRVAWVLLLTLAMCTLSGLGAARKLRSADPADLF